MTCVCARSPTLNVFERRTDSGLEGDPRGVPLAKLEGDCCFGGVLSLLARFENKLSFSTLSEATLDNKIKLGDVATLTKQTPKTHVR
jgi:hypothetical protein